jgi:hypothetical protein
VYVPASSRIRVFIQIQVPRYMTQPEWQALPGEIAMIKDVEGEEPAETDWQPAMWIGKALSMVIGEGGTSSVPYPPGDFMAWARIHAGEEVPVLRSGRVRVGGPGYPPIP